MVGVVAQGWNINGWALRCVASFLVQPSFVGVWNGLVGWFEVETRYWVVRLHAPSAVLLVWGVVVGCGWSSLVTVPRWWCGGWCGVVS